MSIYFLDSSALVKRYITESGSSWIEALVDPGEQNLLIITRIAWVEVLSALARRLREGCLSSDDVKQAVQSYRYDFDMQYSVVELDPELAELAGELVLRFPLRAYDAVQLAAAVKIWKRLDRMDRERFVFLTADDRLLSIAQNEGLFADNPNHHI